MAAHATRGYEARACGFDLDGDGDIGEAIDDCNICDGTSGTGPVTVDYDGDTTNETEVYIDGDSGVDSASRGGPSDPYKSISYAMSQEGSGEIAYCFKGTVGNDSLTMVSGSSGTYTDQLTATVSYSFTLPQNPLMIVGWDADNDGEYPPYDTDDTAIADGNVSGNTAWFATIDGDDYIEMAHFTAKDYNLGGSSSGGFVYRTGGGGDHHYFHDLYLEAINKGYGDSSSRGVFISFGGNDDTATVFNVNMHQFGGYMWRGEAQSPEVGGLAVIKLTALGYGGTGASGDNVGGIKWWGYVTNNFVLDSILDADPDTWGGGYSLDTVYGIAPAQCSRSWTIKNNEITDFEYAIVVQPDAGAGYCQARTLKDVVIDSNIITNTFAPYNFGDYGISVQGGSSVTATVENVTITNNYLSSSTGWEACLWLNPGNGGGTNPGEMYVANNTCYGDINRHAAIVVGNPEGGEQSYPEQTWTIKNNIVDGLGSGDIAIQTEHAPSGWDADYNVYDDLSGNKFIWNAGSATNFSTWKTNSSGDANSDECSPTFEEEGTFDIHLASGDTCAQDNGVSVSAITSIDIDNDSRPQNSLWDIGADEYASGTDVSVSVTGVTVTGVTID